MGRIDRATVARRAHQRRHHRRLFGDRRRGRAACRADARRTPSATTPGPTGSPPCFSRPLLAAWRGRGVWREFAHEPARAAAGGVAAFTGYALVVWAMTRAAIGEVAALRECSVVFAAIIGVVVLGEPFRRVRGAATLLILAGVAALKFA